MHYANVYSMSLRARRHQMKPATRTNGMTILVINHLSKQSLSKHLLSSLSVATVINTTMPSIVPWRYSSTTV